MRNQRGFSLVELLVVTVVMGLVVAATYTLYVSTQRTAVTSEEVVDVQQNLRFALDQIASDIRMAGFLVPEGTPALSTTPADLNGNDLVMNTTMQTRRFARIESVTDGSTTVDITVADSEMVDLFNQGDRVYVFRPSPYEELAGAVVDAGKDRGARKLVLRTLTADEVTAEGLAAAPPLVGVEYLAGDVLVASDVSQITYNLDTTAGGNAFLLRRNAGGNNDIVANKISGVQLQYIPDVADVVAVRILMEGQTDETMTGQANFSGVKTRALETVVRLRNR